MTVEERFWSKVTKTDTCWLWNTPAADGYGSFGANGRSYGAHRFAYLMLKGDIPKGLSIDHLCRVRNCVNPDHLEPVTPRENVLRGLSYKGTEIACGRGHDKSNVFLNKQGMRECRPCRDDFNALDRIRVRGRFSRHEKGMRKCYCPDCAPLDVVKQVIERGYLKIGEVK